MKCQKINDMYYNCGHKFCSDCLEKILENDNECPICFKNF